MASGEQQEQEQTQLRSIAVMLTPSPPSSLESLPGAAQPQQQEEKEDPECHKLRLIVAVLKSRNLELVRENNNLRCELETEKQNVALLQHTGGPAGTLSKLVQEIARLSAMGAPAPPQVQMQQAEHHSVQSRAEEFIRELELPPLAAPPAMTVSATTTAADPVPCIYTI